MMPVKEILTNLKLVEFVDDLDSYKTSELVQILASAVIETGNTLAISLLVDMYYAGELPLLLLCEFLTRCYNEGSKEAKECAAREALLILHFHAVKEILDNAG